MNRFANPQNFANPLRTPLLREHFVYRTFNDDGELLYVGCTARPADRWATHRTTSSWFHLMDRCAMAGPYNYETARMIERDAIQNERPLYNGTPERVQWGRLQNRLVESHLAHLTAIGVPMADAISEACDFARDRIGAPDGHQECRVDDLTLPAVRRRLADALAEIGQPA